MFNIVLYQPEIPPNTGNIIRLCANTGSHLHLIEPLGFDVNHQQLRRAGLDYHEFVHIKTYPSIEAYFDACSPSRWFVCSSKVKRSYHHVNFTAGDALLFGPETRGLPKTLIEQAAPECRITIPMCAGRCLNLSNAVAVVLYEALRQHDFSGL